MAKAKKHIEDDLEEPAEAEEVVIESVAAEPQTFDEKLIAFLESENAEVTRSIKHKHMLHVKRGAVEFGINCNSTPEYLKLTLATFGFDASKFEAAIDVD